MLREFRDTAGLTWRVWDVYPSRRSGPHAAIRGEDATSLDVFPHRELAEGWLCFESEAEKRRLAPIPLGWELWDEHSLRELCSRAGFISRSTPDEELPTPSPPTIE